MTLQNGNKNPQESTYGVTAEVLKVPAGTSGHASGYNSSILNRALESGTAPELWKSLFMVPVPKKGDLILTITALGISLMSITAKLYDKLLLFRIRRVLETVLRSSQNGFRPRRSIHCAADFITEDFMRRADTVTAKFRQSPPLVLVFIDFIKAFDRFS